MKICFIANANSIHTYRWVKFFANKGHTISIISLTEPTFNYKDIKVFALKRMTNRSGLVSHLLNFVPFVQQIVKLKSQIKADVFHALGSSNGLLASAANCEPLLFTIADPGLFSFTNKYPIKKANLLVCDGENTKQAMIKLGANPGKIKMIRYGVDVEKFKRHRIINDSNIIISTKPLRIESDVATLIKAIPIILQAVPEATFHIVGDGDQKQNLIKLAKTLNVSDHIIFFGNVDDDTMLYHLSVADIFVNTSLADTGLAATTTEAMACGVPVVVSKVGDNKMWIGNQYLFPPKDQYELAMRIFYTLIHKDVKLHYRKVVEEYFNYHKEMAKMEKLYLNYEK